MSDHAELLRRRAPAGTPLYVHLPFCAAKCHYCDFFSVAGEGHDVPGMLRAILAEARERAPRKPRSVFFGGGTPSYLSCDEWRWFGAELQAITDFQSADEVTAECNPESLDVEKARCLLDLGIRRLSVGFQSMNDATLALFGRVHTAQDALEALEAARTAGVTALSADLIYAAPGQTLDEWERALERVLAFELDHLSAYNLTFERETRFFQWLQSGEVERLPEEVELAMFDLAREKTAAAGLERYEVSNYARAGEACRHNVNYWRNGEYVGLGPSAVSYVGGTRFGNVRAIPAYLSRVGAAGHAVDWSETLPALARLGETWWLALRLTAGVDPEEARARAGVRLDPDRDPALVCARRLVASGHLWHANGRYGLTPSGLPVADAVAREFLNATAQPDIAAASR